MITSKVITKGCFICHGRGHHLTNNQLNKVKEECFDHKKNMINWNRVDRILKSPPAVCEVCHGERFLFYPKT